MGRVVDLVKRVVAWWKASRVGRAVAHYSWVGGALLSGGLAYTALFSVFAVLTVGFTAAVRVLGENKELLDAVVDTVNSWLPGLVDDGSGTGLLSLDQLVRSPATNVTGVIATGVLVWSALSFVANLQKSLRTVFSVEVPSHFVSDLGRRLVTLVLMGVAVVVTSALGIAANTAGNWTMRLLGLTGHGVVWAVVRVVSWLLSAAVDAVFVLFVFVRLVGARRPGRDLLIGSGLAALALGVVRLLGTSIVGAGSRNPLLASFAVLVTLLVWINLIARILLLTAAWTADPPAPPEPDPLPSPAEELRRGRARRRRFLRRWRERRHPHGVREARGQDTGTQEAGTVDSP